MLKPTSMQQGFDKSATVAKSDVAIGEKKLSLHLNWLAKCQLKSGAIKVMMKMGAMATIKPSD
ncbi:hypothetical protein OH492_04700 [Vibrio chagasii]|nr:hypothetical protein [Vibrio chagasii]